MDAVGAVLLEMFKTDELSLDDGNKTEIQTAAHDFRRGTQRDLRSGQQLLMRTYL